MESQTSRTPDSIRSLIFRACKLAIVVLFVISLSPTPSVQSSTSISLFPASPVGASKKFYGDAPQVLVLDIYDGDTFFVNIPSWPAIVGDRIGVRIAGIDTPELKDADPQIQKKAFKVRQRVETLLKSPWRGHAPDVRLRDIQRDKYFRLVARVLVNGRDLGELLIEEKLARPYDGGTKEDW